MRGCGHVAERRSDGVTRSEKTCKQERRRRLALFDVDEDISDLLPACDAASLCPLAADTSRVSPLLCPAALRGLPATAFLPRSGLHAGVTAHKYVAA